MLVILRRNTRFIKVSHFIALFTLKHHCSSTSFTQEQQSNQLKSKKSHIDASAVHLSGVTESILDNCSDLLTRTTQRSATNASSLAELLLSVSNLNPRITRKFWRKSGLEPQDVLELLLGFESNAGNPRIDVKKVQSLLGVFNWARSSSNRSKNFKHLDQSFNIMVGLLVRVSLFRDAESLLLAMDKEGISLDNHEVFSDLIEWHASMDELEKSIHMYDRMRLLNLSPSLSCYHTLLGCLVNRSQTQLLIQVYNDMLDIGIAEDNVYENVIQALCRNGKVQESRHLIKKSFVCGVRPSSLVLNAIASGYCEKKDYDDLLSFFIEMNCHPDIVIGNKILHSMCQDFGVEEAFVFLQELKHLGFIPDAITFGILICWSCHEGNLKNALVYLSEVLSRGLKPHKFCYNSIISGVFKKGMWNHVKDIILEMEDEGISPDMSTFKVLLAGYCKARRFDEVKVMIEKMVNNGLIELKPLQYPISKAFMLLGIDPLAVRLRRDNDMAFSKTEFYDNMGNGLYLEGDIVNFDQSMTRVLDDSLIPDYNRLILNDDGFNTVNGLVHWGQDLSFATFLTLLKKFHVSNSNFKTISTFLNSKPNFQNELDGETLNLLVQVYLKRGFVHNARKLFDEMLKRTVKVENKTYSALVKGLCKKGNSKDLHDCVKLVQNKNWLPFLNDYKTLICSLCKNNMVMEALVLFDHAILDYSHEVPQIFHNFLENLCGNGFTKVAYSLFKKLLERGYDVDQDSDFLDKMILKDLVPNNINYDVLIKNMIRHGKKDKALDLLDTMLKNENIPDSRTYDCLIQDLCDSHLIEEALDLYFEMSYMKLKPSMETHEVVTKKLCELGRTLEAEKVIDCMISEGEIPSKLMFGFVVSRYREERKFTKASEVLKRMQQFGYKPDFETQWSLISTLSKFSGKDKEDDSRNFLSRLLSDSGFKGVGRK